MKTADYSGILGVIKLNPKVTRIDEENILSRFRRYTVLKIFVNKLDQLLKEYNFYDKIADIRKELRLFQATIINNATPNKITTIKDKVSDSFIDVPESLRKQIDIINRKISKKINIPKKYFSNDEDSMVTFLVDFSIATYLDISIYNNMVFNGILDDLTTKNNSKESKLMLLRNMFEISHNITSYQDWIKSRGLGLTGDPALETNKYPKEYRLDTVRSIEAIIGLAK
jgi:hypothetical protein